MLKRVVYLIALNDEIGLVGSFGCFLFTFH